MDEQHIDASVGLAVSLRLFERYRQSGLLQAPIRRVPGFRGACIAYLKLIEGKVVSCDIQDSEGQQHPVPIDFLARLDQEKGPFEWTLITTPNSTASSPPAERRAYVPRPIAPLSLDQLSSWEPKYRMAIHMVYSWIDGRRSIDEIKSTISLPPHAVDEICQILVFLKVIV